ncbi:hypothetical protein VitviT2T_001434 [Vitis vinifera]|uniref:Uncharacterized protein n=1 Tax=Vitis vinifera TaxID=29760 RepID=A0ABY9BFE0_VITVI|nr:hypothetical protein VitviT2T_001434 [Vitis vinifera]
MEDNGMRARSFRNEDYNNRRVFLRSYPLDWGENDEENKDKGKTDEENKDKGKTERVTKECDAKKPVRKKILAVLQWGGGKILILRRFKHKIAIYVVACLPVSFKAPTALISA